VSGKEGMKRRRGKTESRFRKVNNEHKGPREVENGVVHNSVSGKEESLMNPSFTFGDMAHALNAREFGFRGSVVVLLGNSVGGGPQPPSRTGLDRDSFDCKERRGDKL